MSKKLRLTVPDSHEDAEIARGIAADPDTYEPDIDEFRQMKPLGRPRLASPKVAVTIRYDREVIEAFRASGPRWQTRMNQALQDWLKTHDPGTGLRS